MSIQALKYTCSVEDRLLLLSPERNKQTVLQLLLLSSGLGFPLYEDTANGRATTHQLYSFAIEIGFAPMASAALSGQHMAGGVTS